MSTIQVNSYREDKVAGASHSGAGAMACAILVCMASPCKVKNPSNVIVVFNEKMTLKAEKKGWVGEANQAESPIPSTFYNKRMKQKQSK